MESFPKNKPERGDPGGGNNLIAEWWGKAGTPKRLSVFVGPLVLIGGIGWGLDQLGVPPIVAVGVIAACCIGLAWWVWALPLVRWLKLSATAGITIFAAFVCVWGLSDGGSPPIAERRADATLVEVARMSPDFRNLTLYPRGQDGFSTGRANGYKYFMLRIDLSQSGRWEDRITVELSDSSNRNLRLFSPTDLRLFRTGSSEVVVDVFRQNALAGWTQEAAVLELINSDFNDGELSPSSLFMLAEAATMTVTVLLDGSVIGESNFEIDFGVTEEGQRVVEFESSN